MVNMVQVEDSRDILPCPTFGDGGLRDESQVLPSILLVWTLVSGRLSSLPICEICTGYPV